MLSYSRTIDNMYVTNWYYPAINVWQIAPKIEKCHQPSLLAVVRNQYIFALGNYSRSVQILDFTSQSPCWESVADMLVSRERVGVGVLDNCLYVVSCTNIILFFSSNII